MGKMNRKVWATLTGQSEEYGLQKLLNKYIMKWRILYNDSAGNSAEGSKKKYPRFNCRLNCKRIARKHEPTMEIIELSKTGKHKGKYFAKVDSEDFNWLNKYHWRVKFSGQNVYATTGEKPKILMHRLIAEKHNLLVHGKKIDHKDRDGLNCQKLNIRTATVSENAKNRRPNKNGTSKYLGVHRAKRSGFRVRIQYNGKQISLGYFKNEDDAGRAYDEAAKKYHGEFANLNFK